MRLITELQDDAQFLGAVYTAADAVANMVKTIGFSEIRKHMPELTGDETESERKAKLAEQAKKNMLDIAKSAMKEHPEETIAALHALIVLDDGEEFPHGVKLLTTAVKVLNNKDILDFFTSVASLNLPNSDDTSQKSDRNK